MTKTEEQLMLVKLSKQLKPLSNLLKEQAIILRVLNVKYKKLENLLAELGTPMKSLNRTSHDGGLSMLFVDEHGHLRKQAG